MIMRNQPPNFRWWVGGFALLAGVAFVARYLNSGDRPALVFGVLSLALAEYWLIHDREPKSEPEPESTESDRGPEPPDRQST